MSGQLDLTYIFNQRINSTLMVLIVLFQGVSITKKKRISRNMHYIDSERSEYRYPTSRIQLSFI